MNTSLRKTVLVCIVCVITFFANNYVITPDIMESRNIITAREMVYDGNWIVPTMNGELRLEKPPLPTWLTALAEIMAPDNIMLQRGMAGIMALLLVFYFWRFARRILETDPLVPTLLLCTCYNIILMGRTATWDIYCHAFMMGGIYHLAMALKSPPTAWRQFLLAGLFTGLSIMSKGPVSLYALFLPFLASFCHVYRPKAKGKWLAVAAMAAIAVAIGAWWYAYVHISQADALSAVVQKESGSWLNHNVRPWWYYWKFFLETGVWSLLLLTSMLLPLASKQRRKQPQWLFAMLWLVGSLLLLSLLPEKKSRYLLPILIPASYVMGCMVAWWQKSLGSGSAGSPADRWLFRLNAGLIALVVALLPAAAWIYALRMGYISVAFWVAFAIFAELLAAYILRAAISLRPSRLVYGVTVVFLLAECFAMPHLGNIVNNPDMRSIANTRSIKQLDDIDFYHVDSEPLRIELVYAAHRKIRPVSLDSLPAKLPCALLTHEPIGSVLPQSVISKVDTIGFGTYDDNRHPKASRRYSPEFIYRLTVLKPKAVKHKQ